MNYTTNYHLPQWVETDRILMEDFNEAMADIDGSIKAAKTTADTAQKMAERAQSTAEVAQSSADAAQGTANAAYCPTNKPYAFGTYTGDSEVQDVCLGFRPSIVIIGLQYGSSNVEDTYGSCSVFGSTGMSGVMRMSDEGFTLYPNSSNIYPSVNWNNKKYWYIAFR